MKVRGENAAAASAASVQLDCADALDRYAAWPAPTVIIVDGPYGVGGYPGDPGSVDALPSFYRPHIEQWAGRATPATTLWFWGTELSWATVHPVFEAAGWIYGGFHVWDKGKSHIAGNVNGDTIRSFPITTEGCVRYVRAPRRMLRLSRAKVVHAPTWFRQEWRRTGLTLKDANKACEVADAAARKYLTTEDHNWYLPPAEKLEKLVAYAERNGAPTDRPYFHINGELVAERHIFWDRNIWNHVHGVTNVWREPPVRGQERFKDEGDKAIHSCQKPLALMRLIIEASSNPGDVVWEPFGGLCSASLAAKELGRRARAAEINPGYCDLARQRLKCSLLEDATSPIRRL